MKYPYLLLVFVLYTCFLPAQSGNRITLDQIYNTADFRTDWFGPARWLDEGEAFTTLEADPQLSGGMAIVAYDVKTLDPEVLVSAQQLVPTGEEKPLTIDDYEWSADRSKVLIFTNTRRVWRINSRGDYWLLDRKSNELRQLGKGLPESSLMFAKLSPDETKAAYVSGHNLYVEHLATGKQTQLTDDGTERLINGTFDWAYEEEFGCRDGFRWSPDSKSIAYWKIDANHIRDFLMINTTDSVYSFTVPVQYPKVGETPASAKVGIIPVSGGKTTWMQLPGDPFQHYIPRILWHPDGEYLYLQQLNRKQNHMKVFRAAAKSGKAEVVYEEQEKAWAEVVDDWMWLNDGAAFTWVTEKDGWRHLYTISADGKEEQLITKGDYDAIQILQINKETNTVYFIASPEDPTQRYLYRINLDGNGKAERLTPEQQPGTHSYTISPNGDYAFHQYSALMRPTEWSLVDLPKHQLLRQLTTNERFHSNFEKLALPETEFFQITTEDDVTMEGYMLKPPGFDTKKKYPVLFHVYGEPAGQTARDAWGGNTLWHIMMAQHGYIVITLDNRGTPSPKGREWRKSIYRKIGVLNSYDQAMAAKEIIKWPFVDPERIAVWGWSGGGSMTLNLLFRYPEIYKTGISIAPVSNQLYYDNIYQERYMGLPSENMEDFVEGSPKTYAKNLQGNLLLVHGTGDDNVHYQNAESLVNELIKQGKQFQMMAYPNRTHGIYEGRGTRKHLFTMMTNYLLEKMPAEPIK